MVAMGIHNWTILTKDDGKGKRKVTMPSNISQSHDVAKKKTTPTNGQLDRQVIKKK